MFPFLPKIRSRFPVSYFSCKTVCDRLMRYTVAGCRMFRAMLIVECRRRNKETEMGWVVPSQFFDRIPPNSCLLRKMDSSYFLFGWRYYLGRTPLFPSVSHRQRVPPVILRNNLLPLTPTAWGAHPACHEHQPRHLDTSPCRPLALAAVPGELVPSALGPGRAASSPSAPRASLR